ncbi:hypothetical protein ACWD0Z_35225 [Streptomyces sp. NPDC003007]
MPERASAADPGYLMAHFGDGATGQQIYFSHSADGLNWSDLNGGGMTVGMPGRQSWDLSRSGQRKKRAPSQRGHRAAL